MNKVPLEAASLNQLFLEARTFNCFADRAVGDDTLRALYDLLKWGPTSMNTQPARYVFIRSAQEREKLLPAMIAGNVEKTRRAPVTVLVAYDSKFFENLPTQFKAYDAQPMFQGNPGLAEATAFRNGSLQGAYLILAARAMGLDCGPMSGFDPAQVNAAFFPDGRWKVNFIVNLGYGDATGNHPRGPRLEFDQVASIL